MLRLDRYFNWVLVYIIFKSEENRFNSVLTMSVLTRQNRNFGWLPTLARQPAGLWLAFLPSRLLAHTPSLSAVPSSVSLTLLRRAHATPLSPNPEAVPRIGDSKGVTQDPRGASAYEAFRDSSFQRNVTCRISLERSR